MSLIECSSDSSFKQEVLDSNSQVLVDFFATWCGPCSAAMKVLDELSEDRPDLKIVKVNVDTCPEIAQRYGVKSLPTLFLFENGIVSETRLSGLIDRNRIEKYINGSN